MDILLKQKYPLIFSSCLLIVIFCQGSSEGYGYKKDADPVIMVFKSVIFYGKKSDWERIKADIQAGVCSDEY